MSVSSQSSEVSASSSDTDSSIDSSVYITANSDKSDSEILPFDDNVEPLASPEEIAQYEEAVAEEQQLEDMLESRFDGRVDIASW
jgi:hypothetical protein